MLLLTYSPYLAIWTLCLSQYKLLFVTMFIMNIFNNAAKDLFNYSIFLNFIIKHNLIVSLLNEEIKYYRITKLHKLSDSYIVLFTPRSDKIYIRYGFLGFIHLPFDQVRSWKDLNKSIFCSLNNRLSDTDCFLIYMLIIKIKRLVKIRFRSNQE